MNAVEIPSGRKVQPARRLAPTWAIMLCGGAVALAMFGLFMNGSLFKQLRSGSADSQADSLRVLLLRNLILKGETGSALQEDYIRQLGLTGDYPGAFKEIDELLAKRPPPPAEPNTTGAAPVSTVGISDKKTTRSDDGSSDTLRVLELDVAGWAWAAHPGDTLAAAHRHAGLTALIHPGQSTARLSWAAQSAEASGEKDLALAAFIRLAESDTLAAEWYRRAARLSLSMGDCRKASEMEFLAQDHGRSEAERKAAFLDGLRALQACNQLEAAVNEANARVQEFQADSDVLLYLVNLSRSANQPLLAQKYALKLVHSLPGRNGSP